MIYFFLERLWPELLIQEDFCCKIFGNILYKITSSINFMPAIFSHKTVRCSHQRFSFKEGVLKNFAKFTDVNLRILKNF